MEGKQKVVWASIMFVMAIYGTLSLFIQIA